MPCPGSGCAGACLTCAANAIDLSGAAPAEKITGLQRACEIDALTWQIAVESLSDIHPVLPERMVRTQCARWELSAMADAEACVLQDNVAGVRAAFATLDLPDLPLPRQRCAELLLQSCARRRGTGVVPEEVVACLVVECGARLTTALMDAAVQHRNTAFVLHVMRLSAERGGLPIVAAPLTLPSLRPRAAAPDAAGDMPVVVKMPRADVGEQDGDADGGERDSPTARKRPASVAFDGCGAKGCDGCACGAPRRRLQQEAAFTAYVKQWFERNTKGADALIRRAAANAPRPMRDLQPTQAQLWQRFKEDCKADPLPKAFAKPWRDVFYAVINTDALMGEPPTLAGQRELRYEGWICSLNEDKMEEENEKRSKH